MEMQLEDKQKQSRNYTPEEDRILISRMMAAKAAGVDVKAIYQGIADELGRPYGSVTNRWNRLKKITDGGGTDKASVVISKLRTIRAEYAAAREGEIKWRREAEEAKRELAQTRKELTSLKSEYETLVGELHELLAEDAI